jgi:hypothetical protein
MQTSTAQTHRSRPDNGRRAVLSMSSRRQRASRHALGLERHLLALGLRGEARAARVIAEYLDGTWIR